MGDYLRRYWMPIGGASEFDTISIKAVRLFGEDLVLYKDRGGRFGLVDRHCPHRRADLSYGFVEERGLRCNYHGWCMDEAGRCRRAALRRHRQSALARARSAAATTAYPVKEVAGLLWAYMGPQPAPELPIWEPFTWENGFREVVISDIPCNWFQCQENSCDPVHFEWMHENWNARLNGDNGYYSAKHLKLVFEEFDYGFIYKRVREGQREGDPVWTIGRVTLWPNGFYLGNHFEWRVPIDDENTLSVCWFFMRVPKGREPYVQDKIPTWREPDQGRERPLDHEPRHQPGHHRLGRAGPHRRPQQGEPRRQRSRHRDDPQAFLRRARRGRARRRAEGHDPQLERRQMRRAAQHHQDDQRSKASRSRIIPKYPLLNARLKGFRHCFGQPDEVRRRPSNRRWGSNADQFEFTCSAAVALPAIHGAT